VGEEYMEELFHLAMSDRLTHRDQAQSLDELQCFRLRVSEEISKGFPRDLNGLAVSGKDVMRELGIGPSPKVGEVLLRLHGEVLKDPSLNRYQILMDFIKKDTI
jgi:hypothetical protein